MMYSPVLVLSQHHSYVRSLPLQPSQPSEPVTESLLFHAQGFPCVFSQAPSKPHCRYRLEPETNLEHFFNELQRLGSEARSMPQKSSTSQPRLHRWHTATAGISDDLQAGITTRQISRAGMSLPEL